LDVHISTEWHNIKLLIEIATEQLYSVLSSVLVIAPNVT